MDKRVFLFAQAKLFQLHSKLLGHYNRCYDGYGIQHAIFLNLFIYINIMAICIKTEEIS